MFSLIIYFTLFAFISVFFISCIFIYNSMKRYFVCAVLCSLVMSSVFFISLIIHINGHIKRLLHSMIKILTTWYITAANINKRTYWALSLEHSKQFFSMEGKQHYLASVFFILPSDVFCMLFSLLSFIFGVLLSNRIRRMLQPVCIVDFFAMLLQLISSILLLFLLQQLPLIIGFLCNGSLLSYLDNLYVICSTFFLKAEWFKRASDVVGGFLLCLCDVVFSSPFALFSILSLIWFVISMIKKKEPHSDIKGPTVFHYLIQKYHSFCMLNVLVSFLVWIGVILLLSAIIAAVFIVFIDFSPIAIFYAEIWPHIKWDVLLICPLLYWPE